MNIDGDDEQQQPKMKFEVKEHVEKPSTAEVQSQIKKFNRFLANAGAEQVHGHQTTILFRLPADFMERMLKIKKKKMRPEIAIKMTSAVLKAKTRGSHAAK